MRKAVVVTALTGVLAVLAGTVTTAAHATYTPSSAPYSQSANNTVLTNLLNIPDTIPAAPAPEIPHTTYPAAWNDGSKVMTRARIAARVLPGMRVLGTIGLGVTAFDIGWKIGTATYLHFLAPAASTGTGISATALKWDGAANTYPSNYCPSGGENVGGFGFCWKVQTSSSNEGTRVRFPPSSAATITAHSCCGDVSEMRSRTFQARLRASAPIRQPTPAPSRTSTPPSRLPPQTPRSL
jgi:hypothetical protein